MNNYVFSATTSDAHIIKSLVEVLQNILREVCFVFDENGISLETADEKKPWNLMVDLKLRNINFNEFHCKKKLNVGINLQHLYKLLKNIKKKDTIHLFIDKKDTSQLNITITSPTGPSVTSFVQILKLSVMESISFTNYVHPIHIDTSAFQKMCKYMKSIASSTKIYTKGSFIRFSADIPNMYGHNVPFGTLDDKSNDQEYESSYNTNTLNQIIKISGLNNKMQVHIPLEKYAAITPLKISVNAGQLGIMNIYIKTLDQLGARQSQ